jgi:hypothetical protein
MYTFLLAQSIMRHWREDLRIRDKARGDGRLLGVSLVWIQGQHNLGFAEYSGSDAGLVENHGTARAAA